MTKAKNEDTAAPVSREFELPSGKKITIRVGRGWDQVNATRKAKEPIHTAYALAAELIEIDGQKVPYEDLLDLPLSELNALMEQEEILGPKGLNAIPPDTLALLG